MHWIDPDCLPKTSGKVERFVTNAHGEIDGLVLNGSDNGATLVHVPPHMGAAIEASIQLGDSIAVCGVRPRGAAMIVAVALTTADGRSIADNGPGHEPEDGSRKSLAQSNLANGVTLAGKVRLPLHGPKGELRGALLEDGGIVRIAPNEAKRFAKLLQSGASVAARGEGVETPYGWVVGAKEIGDAPHNLKPIKESKHPR